MDLGARIAHWRKYKGWSEAELAKRVGVTPAAVYHWEATDETAVMPLQTTLAKIVSAFNISIKRFYGPLPKIVKAA